MKRLLSILILLILLLIGVVFARLNAASVVIDFYLFAAEAPLALLIYLALALGAVAGILVTLMVAMRARREARRLRKRLAVTEQEIKNLREIPIKGQL